MQEICATADYTGSFTLITVLSVFLLLFIVSTVYCAYRCKKLEAALENASQDPAATEAGHGEAIDLPEN